jgi:hypothetical protein
VVPGSGHGAGEAAISVADGEVCELRLTV